MSRFFGIASDSSSNTSSEDEEEVTHKSNFLSKFETSDGSDVRRIVRPAHVKLSQELHSLHQSMTNFQKINDFASVLTAFENLMKTSEKLQHEVKPPAIFLRCLVEIDGFISKSWLDADLRKSMSKIGSKSLVALRQKFKKFSKPYEGLLVEFNDNPVEQELGEKVIEDCVSDKNASNENLTDWKETDSSESDISESCTTGVDYFMKKAASIDKEVKRRARKFGEKTKVKGEKSDLFSDEKGKPSNESSSLPGETEKLTVESVTKKLKLLAACKGNSRFERKQKIEQLVQLQKLNEIQQLGVAVSVKVKTMLAVSIFEYDVNFTTGMNMKHWSLLLTCLKELSSLLFGLQDLQMGSHITEDSEDLSNVPYKINGSIVSLIERLDIEFVKILKECDPHGLDCLVRLQDEIIIVEVIDKFIEFVERQGNDLDTCKIYLQKINHLYFKIDPAVFEKKQGTSIDLMDQMCKFIYQKDTTSVLRTRAMLTHVYHCSLHNDWAKARDLMLMSHLQDDITHSDVSTQILYNRAMAQLGLCAFRLGLFIDAHNCLADLMSTGKAKELLGQGFQFSRGTERSREQELKDRMCHVPFHMYIPLDVFDCAYLISAMLIDVPKMTLHQGEVRRRWISKSFYNLLRTGEKQVFVGPPESMREHISAATRALKMGKWKEGLNYLTGKKMQAKVWGLIQQPFDVLSNISLPIKEAALKTYIVTASEAYDTVSLPLLSAEFKMSKEEILKIVTGMILSDELNGRLDYDNEILILQYSTHCKRHVIATINNSLELITNLIETNEKMLRGRK